MTESQEQQVERFDRAVESFSRAVDLLDQEMLLAPLSRWSPRDIIAHLIGWNRYIIRGSRQIQRGQLPFYDVDPGENFAKVNRVLVRKYASTSKAALLDELSRSAAELEGFLSSLEPEAWRGDYGVRHRGEVVTIRGTVEDLIEDYAHHEQQIRDVAAHR